MRRQSYTPGPRGAVLLIEAADRGSVTAQKASDHTALLRLHDHGLLARDPQSSTRFTITDAGIAKALKLEAAQGAAN